MKTDKKFQKARALIEGGQTTLQALKRVRMSTTTYYKLLKQQKGSVRVSGQSIRVIRPRPNPITNVVAPSQDELQTLGRNLLRIASSILDLSDQR